MSYDSFDMECWIYDFAHFKLYDGVIAENTISCCPLNLRRCHYGKYCDFKLVFSLFFLIYEGVIAKKNGKKSGIGVVYTSGVSFWIYRKTCVNVNSGN